jgi:PAS domain S-box-containing protein
MRAPWPLSIRTKIMAIVLAVTSAALLVVGLVDLATDIASFRDVLLGRGLMTARLVGEYCVSPIAFSDVEALTRVLGRVETVPAVMNARVFGTDGTLLASYDRSGSDGVEPSLVAVGDHRFVGEALHVAQRISFDGRDYGSIYLRLSAHELSKRIGRYVVTLGSLMLCVLLAALVLAGVLQGLISKPILRLASVMEEVSKERDFSVHIETTARDEIGTLYRGFNVMVDRVRERELERDKALAELRASEARYSGLVERLSEAVFRLSVPQGRFEYVSPAARAVFGYAPSHFVEGGVPLRALVHPDFVTWFDEVWAGVVRGEVPPAFEYAIADGRGAKRWILQSSTCVLEGGRCIALEGACFDITQRKLAEERVARLAAAVEQAGEAIVLTDTAGIIIYVNPALERVTGYVRSEVVGQTSRIFKSGTHGDAFYADLWGTIRAGQVWSGRIINRRKSGDLLIEDATISPIRGPDGETIGYVAVERDVTEQVNIEAHLRQAQKMEAIGTLAGGIAHDFNNILTAVLNLCELANLDATPGSRQKENLGQLRKACLRAADLVRQILTFGRRGDPPRQPFQLAPLVKEASKLLRASLPSTIDLQLEVRPVSSVLASPIQLHQVLMNLCTNAGLAMSAQGGVLRILLDETEVGAAFAERHPTIRTGRFVRLQVSDTGPGIPAEIRERIFEPFFTTRPSGEGTGMGLAVVHGIVQAHGGVVTAESEPGRGAVFAVYLPALPVAAEAQEEAPEEAARGTERLLFVDDEETVVMAAEQLLARLGYQVVGCSSSLRALELFRADPLAFDIVVSDMTMPKMTGDLLAKAMLELRPDLPVILCTGYSERATPEAAGALGIKAVIGKPMLPVELARAIRLALGH